MNLVKKITDKFILLNLKHNFIFNNFLIWFGLENKFNRRFNPYVSFVPDKNRSTQENAGYSDRREINEVLEKSKKDLLNCIETNVSPGGRILDVGCGPGFYLSLLCGKYRVDGTDINSGMIEEAKKVCPGSDFYYGHFLSTPIKGKYDFIYCIGVLIYISRSDLDAFFEKIAELLVPGGILYLNYPHALSLADVLHADITYLQYSPKLIENMAEKRFAVISHEHAFDGRKISWYDRNPYKSLNPSTGRTYKNSYLLIAKKSV